jgi:hypothetical protein
MAYLPSDKGSIFVVAGDAMLEEQYGRINGLLK